MKNTGFRIMALLAASALMLTGCGNKDKGADDSDEVVVTVAPTEETSGEETEAATEETTEDITETETETAPETTEAVTEEDTSENVSEAHLPDTAQVPTDGLNVFTSLKTGLSMDETFAVTGTDYDLSEETFKGGECYTWLLDKENVFGTGIAGNMFVEFDRNKALTCFGYHLGGKADGEGKTKYPYSPEELERAFNTIYSQFLSQYGEPDRVDTLRNDSGNDYVKGEKEWLFENEDSLWLMYGINLWVDGEPANYEDGINELIVSMAAPVDYSFLN